MKKYLHVVAIWLCAFVCGCRKDGVLKTSTAPPAIQPELFEKYIIPQGEHYATDNVFKPIETSELKFVVKFDSSAIYQTADPENQYDINKLFGLSDNGAHHQQFSARFGWRWSDGALRLFAYTYNNGLRDSKELGTIAIGKGVYCSIKVSGELYLFTMNKQVQTMSRLSITEKAKGYQLYPYFGGDEVAPHDVRIWIRKE